jgi:hypothetical protein
MSISEYHLNQFYQRHVLMNVLEFLPTDDAISLMFVTKRFHQLMTGMDKDFWRKRFYRMKTIGSIRNRAKKPNQSYMQGGESESVILKIIIFLRHHT